MSEIVTVNITIEGIDSNTINSNQEHVSINAPVIGEPTNITHDSFTANFTTDEGTDYLIFIFKDDDEVVLFTDVIAGTETNYLVENLTSSTNYRYEMKAIKDGVISELSTLEEAMTKSNYPNDWNFENIGKGFYLNFANENGENKTVETVSNLVSSFSNPFYNYKGGVFDGNTAQGIYVTDTLHTTNEKYTKLTMKGMIKPSSVANFRVIYSKGLGGDGTFENRLLLGESLFLLQFFNGVDYGNNNVCDFAYNLGSNWSTSTLYSFIVSVDVQNKLKTLVINGVGLSDSFNHGGNIAFDDFDQFTANRGGQSVYQIGRQDNSPSWNFQGLIYRPYVSTTEFITEEDAIAEMSKFGY